MWIKWNLTIPILIIYLLQTLTVFEFKIIWLILHTFYEGTVGRLANVQTSITAESF